ncbi:MAG: hypothetical protein FWB86_09030 [Treponema sp.]|nr:hypothetical protein [Treponema sp.]MCL2251568.1 hypothetical protein [Treponema sp.]
MGKKQAKPTESLNDVIDRVWATLDRISQEHIEIDRLMKENAKETARQMKENAKKQEDADRQSKENARKQEETARQIQEYNKRFGDFTNRFGEIVEYMIAPNLRERFNDLGLFFPTTSNGFEVSDHKNQIFLEIDFFLQNGEKAMLVEVKSKLTAAHIKEHIKRLEKMRKYADLHGDKRMFLGAVAGVVISKNVKENALKQGLYVLEPSGETFHITPPFGTPKEW